MQVKAKVGSCTVWCCRHSPQNRELVITGGFSFKFISMIIIIMTSMIMIIIDWTKWEIQMFLIPKHRSGCGNSEFTRVQIPRQGFLTFQMLRLFLLFLHFEFLAFDEIFRGARMAKESRALWSFFNSIRFSNVLMLIYLMCWCWYMYLMYWC